MKYWILTLLALVILQLSASHFEDKMLKEESERIGNEIFQRMINSIGDFQIIENIKTISLVTKNVDAGTITFQSEVFAVFPDKILLKFEDKEFIINDNNGWIKYPKGYYENLSNKMTLVLRSNLEKNIINIVKNRKDFKFYFKEIVTLDEKDYEIIEVINNNKKNYISDFLIYIDTETYFPYKLVYSGSGNSLQNSDLVFEKYYLDFKDISGYFYPSHTITKSINGNQITENKLLKIQTNLSYDKSLFQ